MKLKILIISSLIHPNHPLKPFHYLFTREFYNIASDSTTKNSAQREKKCPSLVATENFDPILGTRSLDLKECLVSCSLVFGLLPFRPNCDVKRLTLARIPYPLLPSNRAAKPRKWETRIPPLPRPLLSHLTTPCTHLTLFRPCLTKETAHLVALLLSRRSQEALESENIFSWVPAVLSPLNSL